MRNTPQTPPLKTQGGSSTRNSILQVGGEDCHRGQGQRESRKVAEISTAAWQAKKDSEDQLPL